MKKRRFFRSGDKKISLPVFFPDATRAVVRTLDSEDIRNSKTPGILVNTYHLKMDLEEKLLDDIGGVREFMNWNRGVISDSGGFQVMSLAKKSEESGQITDEGVTFKPEGERELTLTPEDSIRFQMKLDPDMLVVLDDFTDIGASKEKAEETVERTIKWAKRCKKEFEKICEEKKLGEKSRPYILGVVQGGEYLDLRRQCTKALMKIGFDGLGYGGWPMDAEGQFNFDVARVIADNTPEDYFLYGLGIGKPHEIVELVNMGYDIFDCVLPTRDARHGRLYIFNADSIDKIDVGKKDFWQFYTANKGKHRSDMSPVSKACDCLLCTDYSRAYLYHLFRIKEISAMRLATIHNLRFYSLLMKGLQT